MSREARQRKWKRLKRGEGMIGKEGRSGLRLRERVKMKRAREHSSVKAIDSSPSATQTHTTHKLLLKVTKICHEKCCLSV